ncbi:MAG TPA: FAD-dependent oxidoreductase [Verrucomicrobiae bacterium]|nr:FAD-dependent oxidoreductase [Verrucomicrobiae bacterium]
MSMLFSPARIGTLQLKNRFVMTPMHLGYCPTGEVTDKLVEFYRARAAGGVGLIIVGGCGIDKFGNAWGMIQLDEDRFIPGLCKLTEAIHAAGAKIIPQLYQAGRYAHTKATGKPCVAPSPVPSKLTGETPEELTPQRIKEIIASYAGAASRVKRAGFDGLEILASAGYLISQFLSPLTNLRMDRYGGDLQGRMTFALEVVAAVRQAVGPDFPILVRIAGNDFMPGSHTNSEARAFAQALQQAGVDGLNVTGGWHETRVPQLTMNLPQGGFAYLAKEIKHAVSIPVIACNRINTPETAEKILREGMGDFIGIARPLLADPELPNKLQAGRAQTIRPCIGCNQGCLDHVFRLKPVACLTNPLAGREAEVPKAKAQPGESHKVLVIGAGPAGLEFSRTAATLGHTVTLWEEKDGPGGQLILAAAPPGRKDFLNLVTYLENSCRDLGVKIHYGKQASPEDILARVSTGEFDQVVIATGARPISPAIPGEGGACVVDAWQVLSGGASPGKNIVVVGGGAVGVETALYLAQIGTIDAETLHFLFFQQAEKESELRHLLTRGTKNITLIEMDKGLGRDIGASTRWSMLADLARHGVTCLDQTKVVKILKTGVMADTPKGEAFIPADTVIMAVGSAARNELFERLKGKILHLSMIGDAVKPRKAMEAIHEGYNLAAGEL